MEKSKIYTQTGDKGMTSLVGGQRVKKCSTRLESYGTVDELNSWIGTIIAAPDINEDSRQFLIQVQSRLFDLGAYLATENPDDGTHSPVYGITDSTIANIESQIDILDSQLPKLKAFVLPSGTQTAAFAHICRTVTRRAERRVIALADETYVDSLAIKYLNRLSDYFFVLARFLNVNSGKDEILWQKG